MEKRSRADSKYMFLCSFRSRALEAAGGGRDTGQRGWDERRSAPWPLAAVTSRPTSSLRSLPGLLEPGPHCSGTSRLALATLPITQLAWEHSLPLSLCLYALPSAVMCLMKPSQNRMRHTQQQGRLQGKGALGKAHTAFCDVGGKVLLQEGSLSLRGLQLHLLLTKNSLHL